MAVRSVRNGGWRLVAGTGGVAMACGGAERAKLCLSVIISIATMLALHW